MQVVREHMESENRRAFDKTLATFARPHYELVATGTALTPLLGTLDHTRCG